MCAVLPRSSKPGRKLHVQLWQLNLSSRIPPRFHFSVLCKSAVTSFPFWIRSISTTGTEWPLSCPTFASLHRTFGKCSTAHNCRCSCTSYSRLGVNSCIYVNYFVQAVEHCHS